MRHRRQCLHTRRTPSSLSPDIFEGVYWLTDWITETLRDGELTEYGVQHRFDFLTVADNFVSLY